MKPSSRNLFIKKFTRLRVVPTNSANLSCEIADINADASFTNEVPCFEEGNDCLFAHFVDEGQIHRAGFDE